MVMLIAVQCGHAVLLISREQAEADQLAQIEQVRLLLEYLAGPSAGPESAVSPDTTAASLAQETGLGATAGGTDGGN